MSIISRVLVVVDPDQPFDQPSVQRALQVARQPDVELELFSCQLDRGYLHTQFLGGLDVDKVRSLHRERIEALLQEYCKKLEGHSITCQWSVISSLSLAAAIERRVEQYSPTLVIKQTRYHRTIARALLSHTDWDLIRECPVPLWLVKEGETDPSDGIIACIDPSHPDEQHARTDEHIIRQARELASCLDTQVSFFHALAPLADFAKPFVMDKVVEAAREEQRAAIGRYQQRFDIAPDRLHVVDGFAEHTLGDLIEKLNAGVVVLGAIARHGPQKVLIGSTAERLLDRVPCDVLIVKPRPGQ